MRIVRDHDSFSALRAELMLPLLRFTLALRAQRIALAAPVAGTANGDAVREPAQAYEACPGWTEVQA